jgi:lysozyme family protein
VYSPAFLAAVAFTLRQEGGYANSAADPGGETNFGISKRQYPQLDIEALTRDAAIAIYHRDYWQRVRGDELPFPIAVVLFDTAVNGGAPVRWLQLALGGLTVDGQLGPATIVAAQRVPDPLSVALRVLRRRIVFNAGLATWKDFGATWVQRALECAVLAASTRPA